MIVCPTHPTYRGRKQPRSTCQICHIIWLKEEIARLRKRHDDIMRMQEEYLPHEIRMHLGLD